MLPPDASSIELYGFGAAGHLVALAQVRRVFAFTRRGDEAAQQLARSLGAHWASDSKQSPPEPLDGAILFAPAGELVPRPLRAVAPGGGGVCTGIRMSDISSFPYRWLWLERSVRSVANLTRRDAPIAVEHTCLSAGARQRCPRRSARRPSRRRRRASLQQLSADQRTTSTGLRQCAGTPVATEKSPPSTAIGIFVPLFLARCSGPSATRRSALQTPRTLTRLIVAEPMDRRS